ncbi:hypothetical protein HIM_07034 [Hirsutella minnesotensis 3608]|uniref:Uncharacterized protein n=1 Tax=Hirsutella minnesotensis 3608 TaxID=1043627 RepID=A0A0F7ZTP6_9HYPO|nr:hypothetical protein HIM_07034 [Hirsutella minnesotensis 3608]
MDPACEFVEFFVFCEPPLRPDGVDSAVRLLTAAYPAQVELLEVLYEPQHAWFKLIAQSAHQDSITDTLASILQKTIEDDARHPGPSRIIPWSLVADTYGSQYDSSQWPADIQQMTFKAAWRGLQSRRGWTISQFLQDLMLISKNDDMPSTLRELETHVQCLLTHNMAGNLIYLGSNSSRAQVDEAVQILENFRQTVVSSFDANDMAQGTTSEPALGLAQPANSVEAWRDDMLKELPLGCQGVYTRDSQLLFEAFRDPEPTADHGSPSTRDNPDHRFEGDDLISFEPTSSDLAEVQGVEAFW